MENLMDLVNMCGNKEKYIKGIGKMD